MTDSEKEVKKYIKKKKDRDDIIETLKSLFQIVGYIVGIICCVLVFIHKIRNPHLTETEIMLYSFSKYWWVVVFVIISTLINNK